MFKRIFLFIIVILCFVPQIDVIPDIVRIILLCIFVFFVSCCCRVMGIRNTSIETHLQLKNTKKKQTIQRKYTQKTKKNVQV